jgi:benzodiazapine receptor
MKIILTWLLFLGVIAVNALANILPINGYNTGQISAFYPNAFVPAGFTFSIWGVIYTLLLTYTIAYTFYTTQRNAQKSVIEFIDKVHPFYLLTCVLNMAWIIAWHYLQIELSVIIMYLFLITLIQLFLKSRPALNLLTNTQQFLLNTPFMVYLGWIAVATIANSTALLVDYQWSGFGIDPVYWSAIMILIAILLAWYMIYQFKALPFSLVIIWALWGIYNAQGPAAPILAKLTVAGIGVLFAALLRSLIQMRNKNKLV